MFNLKETTRPFTDLENQYSELSRLCMEEKRAVILTVDGEAKTVLLALDDYRRMTAELELLEILMEAESDIRDGRTAPVEQTFREVREELAGKVRGRRPQPT